MSLSGFLAILPNALLLVVWFIGLGLTVAHRGPGNWRPLALTGFALLAAAALVGALPLAVFSLGRPHGAWAATTFGLIATLGTILQLGGAGCLIAAVLSGRSTPDPDRA